MTQVWAHRGASGYAPENTLPAFELALEQGADGFELDVQLTRDDEVVVIHDETLERTTNGVGRVCETPDAVLFALDAGKGERIPTLAEAAALCQRYGLLANIEIKPAAGHEAATGACVARFVQERWQGLPPLLSSFSAEALQAAWCVAPELQYGLLFEAVPADWQRQCGAIGAVTLHCAAGRVTDALLAEAAAAGVPVLASVADLPSTSVPSAASAA